MLDPRSFHWPETGLELANFTVSLACLGMGLLGLAHILIPWFSRRKQ